MDPYTLRSTVVTSPSTTIRDEPGSPFRPTVARMVESGQLCEVPSALRMLENAILVL